MRASEASLRLLRQGRNLSVDAFAQVTNQNSTATTVAQNWIVGITATKPLFDGGMEDAQVREQLSKIREAKVGV